MKLIEVTREECPEVYKEHIFLGNNYQKALEVFNSLPLISGFYLLMTLDHEWGDYFLTIMKLH